MTTIGELRGRVWGDVVVAGDGTYDGQRRVYNAMHDRRPDVIVRCTDAADVIAAVDYARHSGTAVAIRGGGHSVAGFGTCDGGVVIDLSPMSAVRVDPTRAIACAGGGATWGDFDHATHARGLATTGGVVSTTGVGGLTLGGGIGHLTRRCGLTIDSLQSVDVVTADGRLVTATEYENADLFWAIRGGGGNFGVVTSFEFALHPIATIVGGPILYDAADAAAVMAFFRDFIAEAPDELGCFFRWGLAAPLAFIPAASHGEALCGLVSCWSGPLREAEQMFKPLLDIAEVKAHNVQTMPYPALNCASDAMVPPGMQHYWKADFVAELTDEAIAAHAEHGPLTPTMSSTMHLFAINGAVHRVGPDETAFGHRDKNFVAVVAGAWPDPADNDRNMAWVADYHAAIHPHSGCDGSYVNFLGGDDADRTAASFGGNYARLRAVKRSWDPNNLFRVNHNIPPG